MPEIRMESFKVRVLSKNKKKKKNFNFFFFFKKISQLPEITGRVVTEQQKSTTTTMIKPTQRPIPPNYICPYCKKPGHFKYACPEVAAGLVTKEDTRPRYPTGIPRSFMIRANAGDPGAMLGPEGHVIPKLDL